MFLNAEKETRRLNFIMDVFNVIVIPYVRGYSINMFVLAPGAAGVSISCIPGEPTRPVRSYALTAMNAVHSLDF